MDGTMKREKNVMWNRRRTRQSSGRVFAAVLAGIMACSMTACVKYEQPTETSESVTETAAGEYTLSNTAASEKTQKIYRYICENYGTNMLSCQQESTWMGSPDYEMDYIQETTGKLPAMRG
ncbi:MAG: hypothetical protein J6O53_06290, partial [Eubacterium sp.]|nr:hypothetical protein [Eubacterium sp.]